MGSKFSIQAVTPTVGLSFKVTNGVPGDYTSGFNHRDFHYCPAGPWKEWVALARWIIAEDRRRARRKRETGRQSPTSPEQMEK